MRKRRGNVLFWPTVYTEPFFYPATDEDYCIRKCYRIYTMSFSYENVSIPFSHENDVVQTGPKTGSTHRTTDST